MLLGQKYLQESILNMGTLGGLTILLGPTGSGKTLMSEWIAHQFEYRYITINNKIADIRQLIEDTVALNEHTVYYIKDGDNMTIQAMNAMLKIAEEPPKNVHIILGLTDTNNTLQTIISRAKILVLDSYTHEQMTTYFDYLDVDNIKHKTELIDIANTPGLMQTLIAHNFDNCYEYAQLVYDNILQVTTGNAFKICNRIGFKDEENMIPVDLFLRIYLNLIRTKILENYTERTGKYVLYKQIDYTLTALKDISRKGANKKIIFDIWVLNIRRLRME